MSEFVFYSQPGYILHQQNYRESSLIADVLTRDFGRISLLAKGVRKTKSKTVGLLRPFELLSVSFIGKSSLKLLTHVEMLGVSGNLVGMSLYCGFYINELIRHFLPNEDPYPDVFHDYQHCLAQLSHDKSHEAVLRVFEMNLMDNVGYGINFEMDLKNEKPIDSTKKYLFNNEDGLVEDSDGAFSGSVLTAMAQRTFDDPLILSDAKKLMRLVIDSRLQGKPLHSRAFMTKIAKRLE